MRLVRSVAALLFWGIASAAIAAVPAPSVVLVVVDGLDGRFVSESLTPTIAELAARGVFHPEARAVMPSVTNTNHVSLVTGAYPAAHGIVGNRDWDRGSSRRPRRLDEPRWIETDTIFTALAVAADRGAAVGVFGKWKLANLFRYEESGRVWADLEGEAFIPSPGAPHGSDERTMSEVVRVLAEDDPRFLFVNLGDVDRTSHVYGPESSQARAALIEADRQVARLVRALEHAGRWERTVLVITADHGFSDVSPSSDRPYPTLSFGRELEREKIENVVVVANGRTAFVYLADVDPTRDLTSEERERLREIRRVALRQPEIAEALYRRPNPLDGGDEHTVGSRHPDWKLGHSRAGELVLVASPGSHLNDPWSTGIARMRGTHGGPEDRRIPLVWSGGWEGLGEPRTVTSSPTNADVGMTVRRLLGLGRPRSLVVDGREVPPELRGVVLPEIVP